MKNKIYKIFLILFLTIGLFGCSPEVSPIEEIDFNVEFKELDLENNTAKFIVDGYPNEKEFAQISTIILDSLTAQNIESNKEIEVFVYSSFDQDEKEPFFGKVVYKNGEIIQNDLTNNKEEEFLKLVKK